MLVTDYSKLSDHAFSGLMKVVTSSMRKHPTIHEPYPSCCATLDQTDAKIVEFDTAIVTASNGGKLEKEKRKAARAELKEMATGLARYFTLAANGDKEALLATGFVLVKEKTKTQPTRLDRPKFSVSHGTIKGMVIGKANYNRRAASYEVHWTVGDPNALENWTLGGIFPRCSHMELMDMESGRSHFFKARVHGVGGTSDWSDPCPLMPL
jgi:hypothetical protein